jgi:hypothetical protein
MRSENPGSKLGGESQMSARRPERAACRSCVETPATDRTRERGCPVTKSSYGATRDGWVTPYLGAGEIRRRFAAVHGWCVAHPSPTLAERCLSLASDDRKAVNPSETLPHSRGSRCDPGSSRLRNVWAYGHAPPYRRGHGGGVPWRGHRSMTAICVSSWRSPAAGVRLFSRSICSALSSRWSAAVFSSTRETRLVPGIGAMSPP